MTNKEFENYLALVSRLLRLKRGQREQIAVELRDHLELRVAELASAGVDVDEATRRALEEFGDAASLAGQFQFLTETYRKRWMMRFATLSVAGLFLTAVLVMAMWPTNARFGSPDAVIASLSTGTATSNMDEEAMSYNSRRNMEIRRILQTEVSMDYDEMPIQNILGELSAKHNINFILDSTAEDDSLAADEPITFKVQNIPLNKTLKLMLRDYNASYVVNDAVVRIISRDVSSDPVYFSRQIFDVSNLLDQISKLEKHRIGTMKRVYSSTHSGGRGGGIFCVQDQDKNPESVQASQVQQNVGSSGGGGAGVATGQNSPPPGFPNNVPGGGGGFGGGGNNYHAIVLTPENMLVDLVKTTVAPNSWSETRGDGTLEVLGGLMVVTQSEIINQQIDELLQDLNYRFSVRLKNNSK